MKLTVSSVLNQRWKDSSKSIIICDVTFSEYGDIIIPFGASPKDVEDHGRDLFERLVNGEFGPIDEPWPEEQIAQPTDTDVGQTVVIDF